jgi:hypothetical protein
VRILGKATPECQIQGIVKNDFFYGNVEPAEMMLFQKKAI